MVANYLVQVRKPGEPWKTLVGYASEREALARAQVAAFEQGPHRTLDGRRSLPRYNYVRVTLRGRVISDRTGRMLPAGTGERTQ